MESEFLEDARNLGWCFALRQNDFRRTHSQRAMVVYFGEPQVFERQMFEPFDSIIWREFAGTHLFEKFANGFRVHDSSVVSTQVSIGALVYVSGNESNCEPMLWLNSQAWPVFAALDRGFPVWSGTLAATPGAISSPRDNSDKENRQARHFGLWRRTPGIRVAHRSEPRHLQWAALLLKA